MKKENQLFDEKILCNLKSYSRLLSLNNHLGHDLEEIINSYKMCEAKIYATFRKRDFLSTVDLMLNSLYKRELNFEPIKTLSNILSNFIDKREFYLNDPLSRDKFELFSETTNLFGNVISLLNYHPNIYHHLDNLIQSYNNHSNLGLIIKDLSKNYFHYQDNFFIEDEGRFELFFEVMGFDNVKNLFHHTNDEFVIDKANYSIRQILSCGDKIDSRQIVTQMANLFNKSNSADAKNKFLHFSGLLIYRRSFNDPVYCRNYVSANQAVMRYKEFLDLLEPLSMTNNFDLVLESLYFRTDDELFHDLTLKGREEPGVSLIRIDNYLNFLKDHSYSGFIDCKSYEFYMDKIVPNLNSEPVANKFPLRTINNLINVYGLAAYAMKSNYHPRPLEKHYNSIKGMYFDFINELIDSSDNTDHAILQINSWCLDIIQMVKNGSFEEMYFKKLQIYAK